MASYVITGVSQGLGLEFLRQISSNPANTVIGIVRNKTATEATIANQMSRSNVHILQGDLTDYDSLKRAAAETAKVTGGSLDYLIANAGIAPEWSSYDPIGVFKMADIIIWGRRGQYPSELERELLDCFHTNVIGNVHLFNLFLPLIMKGKTKKVIALSTGMADNDAVAKYNLDPGAPYSISKAAMNTAVAKFSAQYANDGILFLSIAPGVVQTSQNKNATAEQMTRVMGLFAKFKEYTPHFEGPSTAESSIRDMMSVIEKSSVAAGDGGAFISHKGNKQWL